MFRLSHILDRISLSDTVSRTGVFNVGHFVYVWSLMSSQVEEIQHFIAPGEAPPSMILNRTDDEDGLQLPSSTTRKSHYLTTVFPLIRLRFRTIRVRRYHLGGYRIGASCGGDALLKVTS